MFPDIRAGRKPCGICNEPFKTWRTMLQESCQKVQMGWLGAWVKQHFSFVTIIANEQEMFLKSYVSHLTFNIPIIYLSDVLHLMKEEQKVL